MNIVSQDETLVCFQASTIMSNSVLNTIQTLPTQETSRGRNSRAKPEIYYQEKVKIFLTRTVLCQIEFNRRSIEESLLLLLFDSCWCLVLFCSLFSSSSSSRNNSTSNFTESKVLRKGINTAAFVFVVAITPKARKSAEEERLKKSQSLTKPKKTLCFVFFSSLWAFFFFNWFRLSFSLCESLALQISPSISSKLGDFASNLSLDSSNLRVLRACLIRAEVEFAEFAVKTLTFVRGFRSGLWGHLELLLVSFRFETLVCMFIVWF